MSIGLRMTAWQFGSMLTGERRELLRRAPAYTKIVNNVFREMKILCCHRCNCDDMIGFSRVSFALAISHTTFDLFFNSEHGYRGAYFKSPQSGLAANGCCIRRLAPALLAWARQNDPSVDQAFAKESLYSPTAKMWLAEVGADICGNCEGEWGNPSNDLPEIVNGRWDEADSALSRLGRKAPYLTKLRVFGAFLNERYDEFTPARKRHRAQEINACGWS
jgi:hypothetical protein